MVDIMIADMHYTGSHVANECRMTQAYDVTLALSTSNAIYNTMTSKSSTRLFQLPQELNLAEFVYFTKSPFHPPLPLSLKVH